ARLAGRGIRPPGVEPEADAPPAGHQRHLPAVVGGTGGPARKGPPQQAAGPAGPAARGGRDHPRRGPVGEWAAVEIAEGLAERVLREGPADDPGRIDLAFRLCLGRLPESAERERLLRFLAVQKKGTEAAWAMVARVLLNLDEFITRE